MMFVMIIVGLKQKLGDLQATCDAQHEELCLLHRDMRVTRTRVNMKSTIRLKRLQICMSYLVMNVGVLHK